MKNPFLIVSLAMVSACSAVAITNDISQQHEVVTTTGSLRLSVSDRIVAGGVLWARPNVSSSASTVSVASTQYGSLCSYDVTGRADVTSTAVTLHISFAPRPTTCPAEIRAVSYMADVSGLQAHAYDVYVIHEGSGRADTVMTQRVSVP